MNKKEKIDSIFNVLIQYEKIFDNGNVTNETYINYLDRLYILYLGLENKEIAYLIKGLYNLGNKASHSSVKRTVFHIINLIEKE